MEYESCLGLPYVFVKIPANFSKDLACIRKRICKGTGFSIYNFKKRVFDNAFDFRFIFFTISWSSHNGWFENVSNSVKIRGRQPVARAPHLARQAISSGTRKFQVLHINFVMIHKKIVDLDLLVQKNGCSWHTDWFGTLNRHAFTIRLPTTGVNVRFVNIVCSPLLSSTKLTYFKWKMITAVFNVNGGVFCNFKK